MSCWASSGPEAPGGVSRQVAALMGSSDSGCCQASIESAARRGVSQEGASVAPAIDVSANESARIHAIISDSCVKGGGIYGILTAPSTMAPSC